MNLEQAIKEIDKIFPMKEREYIPMIIEERTKCIEVMKRFYDKGYELIKRGRK